MHLEVMRRGKRHKLLYVNKQCRKQKVITEQKGQAFYLRKLSEHFMQK